MRFLPADITSVDDLLPILNPVQIIALDTILRLTLEERRVFVALAFCGWTITDWAGHGGFDAPSLNRWIYRGNRLPWGAAFRLSRVMGQSADLLFASYVLPER